MLIVVSNRLPLTYSQTTKTFVKSSGGLVSALSPLPQKIWVGYLGAACPSPLPEGLVAVSMPQILYDQYYNWCNDVLWPILHYYPPQDQPAGELAYLRAASFFSDAVCEVYRPGDVIWVQDYHLFTLPQLLRARLPHASIAFFLHTPFPSSALFLRLEIAEALLAGVLSADLAGFHTSNYAAHFLSACSRALGAEVTATSASLPSATSPLAPRKVTEVVVAPIGIDPLPFTSCLSHAATAERLLELKSFFGDRKLIIAVDRMDPIKGLLQRLHAFESLLTLLTPEQALAPPCLLSVAVPSREASRDYKLLRLSVEALTSSINSKFGKVGEPPPVSLFYRSISHSELCSLLCLGSLCLITSLRDGMNLVALEYVAAQEAVASAPGGAAPGVLVLSEFTGAATCLSGACLVNPHSSEGVARVCLHALYSMKAEEARRRHADNMAFILGNTSAAWAKHFLACLPPPPAAAPTTGPAATATASGSSPPAAFASLTCPRACVIDFSLLLPDPAPFAPLLRAACARAGLALVLVGAGEDGGPGGGRLLANLCTECPGVTGIGEWGMATFSTAAASAAAAASPPPPSSTTTPPPCPAPPALGDGGSSPHWRDAVRKAFEDHALCLCPGLSIAEGAAYVALEFWRADPEQALVVVRALEGEVLPHLELPQPVQLNVERGGCTLLVREGGSASLAEALSATLLARGGPEALTVICPPKVDRLGLRSPKLWSWALDSTSVGGGGGGGGCSSGPCSVLFSSLSLTSESLLTFLREVAGELPPGKGGTPPRGGE
jgi:trehalose 6-phosphate synthase